MDLRGFSPIAAQKIKNKSPTVSQLFGGKRRERQNVGAEMISLSDLMDE